MLRLDPDEKFKLDKQEPIAFNSTSTSPKTIIYIPTKSYVDSLHESSRNRRDVSSVFNDQDNEFDDNQSTNLDSVSVNRNPTSDNELANKIFVDDSIEEGTIVTFNQTLENSFKICVRKATYNLTKHHQIQITDTAFIKPGNGAYLLPRWTVICNDNNNNGKTTKFIRATKSSSPTSQSGATSLPLIGDSLCI